MSELQRGAPAAAPVAARNLLTHCGLRAAKQLLCEMAEWKGDGGVGELATPRPRNMGTPLCSPVAAQDRAPLGDLMRYSLAVLAASYVFVRLASA